MAGRARTDTRRRLLEATVTLLRAKGAAGTGTAEILSASGAPRGSFYFHFPGGKEQLVEEALDLYARQVSDAIVQVLDDRGTPLAERVRTFVLEVGNELRTAAYMPGCAIGVVTSETATTSETLRRTSRSAFATWIGAFAEHLHAEGLPTADAHALATTIVAALEGALILARAERSTEPIAAVADNLALLISAASAA